jgi:hypothetical protein
MGWTSVGLIKSAHVHDVAKKKQKAACPKRKKNVECSLIRLIEFDYLIGCV